MENDRPDFTTLQSRFLESCDAPDYDFKIDSFLLVIFGGTGDLSRRKLLPSLYHLFKQSEFVKDFSIIGFGRRPFTNDDYRSHVESALREFAPDDFDDKGLREFTRHLFYLRGDVGREESYRNLCSRLSRLSPSNKAHRIFYLAVPPDLVPVIAERLSRSGLCENIASSRIVVEKPFGRDRASAALLNNVLLNRFSEKQIFRIDHYLGKETVQNILFFRFGNSIFEPLWNRSYIDQVQITVAESIGIGHRGVFYEQAGVVRDIVQNHIMQLLALVAMEPPIGFEADLVRDEKVKLFKTIRPFDEESIKRSIVFGQYGPGQIGGEDLCGYREEENVAPDSLTPTFFAGRFYIDNWRWAGVPFFIRAGKRLPFRYSAIHIRFRQPPLRLFGRTCDIPEPNALVLSVQPQELVGLRFNVKRPGIGHHPLGTFMEFSYEKGFDTKRYPPYERLLIDCIKGELTLFARQDGVEAMWSVVDPINAFWEGQSGVGYPNYDSGTWGPPGAAQLLESIGSEWFQPDIAS